MVCATHAQPATTEMANNARGATVLYIPDDDLSDLEAASKDKDLVQRLETTLIHWTRQIKEVVNRQDDGEDAEDAGPLAEVQFWSSRTIDLSGIDSQLKRPEVALIVQVLETAKSSYLPPFLTLSDRIQKGTSEAVDNLHFLENLNEPRDCFNLSLASPRLGLVALRATENGAPKLTPFHDPMFAVAMRLTAELDADHEQLLRAWRSSFSRSSSPYLKS